MIICHIETNRKKDLTGNLNIFVEYSIEVVIKVLFCANNSNNPKESKMNDLVDLRLQHHIAQEIYRQQMLQRLPGT